MLSEAPFTVIIQLLLECRQERDPHCVFKWPLPLCTFHWLLCFIIHNSNYHALALETDLAAHLSSLHSLCASHSQALIIILSVTLQDMKYPLIQKRNLKLRGSISCPGCLAKYMAKARFELKVCQTPKLRLFLMHDAASH